MSVPPNAFQAYASVDSAPRGFAVDRPGYICPLFLLMFSLVSIWLLLFPGLDFYYAQLLGKLTGLDMTAPVKLQFRLFFMSFALTFWLFCAGSLIKRFKLLGLMVLLCAAAILLSDLFMLFLIRFNGPGPFSLTGNIFSGYMALLAIACSITSQINLPGGVVVRTRVKRHFHYNLKFLLSVTAAVLISVLLLTFMSGEIDGLRNISLLGGLGPGLLLFSPVLMLILFFLNPPGKQTAGEPGDFPPAAFLVTALNEERHIADCIRSLDEAAAVYPGNARLYLIDNGSADNTCAIAKREMEQCRALKGTLLQCPIPGKAHALNFGLRHIDEEILIRVDADTRIKSDTLVKTAAHFSDPGVGGVGGIPLPKDPAKPISRMRSVEVYYNIGFMRRGHMAVDTVMVIPGIMSAYRRSLLEELGGFCQGLNGEDTDITVRVGRLGYRIVVDPGIEAYSEVPESLAHLREQRLRWSRSFLHVFARNKSAIRMLQGVRGCWVLPMGFIAIFRRTFVIPIILYALLTMIFAPAALYLRDGAAIGSLIAGPALIMTIVVLLAYRRFDLLPHVPSYLVLRLMRAYIALDMLFTLSLKESVATPASRHHDQRLIMTGEG